ncbi:MAG TPA: hypothetical protein VFU71_12830 [Burkholderiaceae bacterium]|nr:hypothetical protein [Burkholderiaceae bacterium]
MNVHPIEQAALVAARPAAPNESASRARETLVEQVTVLARQLADVMLANVQNTASLNLIAARAVLAHARIPTPPNLQHRSDTWRHSWRNFEICATSADQVLNLTRGHVERNTAALWRTTERMLEDMHQLEGAHGVALREAFGAMKAAQTAYWEAAQQVHNELVSMAQAPLSGSTEEIARCTH